jgi:hypothetical protein
VIGNDDELSVYDTEISFFFKKLALVHKLSLSADDWVYICPKPNAYSRICVCKAHLSNNQYPFTRTFPHSNDYFDKALAHYKANIENDYNLNIPRYVDTFETEDSIDINAIAREPKTLEMEMKDTDIAFASFCKELNIDTPF